ncbi:MAG TPA: helix-turn-helix domain-containing protein [Acidimicrobiales bacterium]
MRRKEQAEASRAGLIEAARQCFTAQGYEATTVAEILDRAGMARGALYHYFPGGKREIFQAVFETINDEFHRRRDALLVLDSPLARIGAGVRIFLDLCTEDDFARIALVDAPQLVPGQSERGTTYALLRANLEEARTAREIRRCDIDVTAMALYGAIRAAGEFVMTAEQRQKAAKTAARSLDLLLDGLRNRTE